MTDLEPFRDTLQKLLKLRLKGIMAGAGGYAEDTGVTESESDITKRLKELLRNPKNDSTSLLRSADAF